MLTIVFCISALIGVVVTQRADVCSQVQLMSQYCSSQGSNGTAIGEVATTRVIEEKMEAKLTEMEARLRHTLSDPPDVNYTLVEAIITERFKGVEQRVIQKIGEPPIVNYTAIEESISTRFKRLEALVNGDDDSEASIVDYSRIFSQVDERYTAIRRYVDIKFARLINDTEAYQRAVDEMARNLNVTDCRDIRLEDAKLCNATGGVFDIYRGIKKYEVYCDTYTDGGGWTVFQRRMDGSVNFNRSWNEYVEGFGERHGEFWLGLRNIHEMIKDGTYELRVDMMNSNGYTRFEKYGLFHVTGKSTKYTIMLQSPTGDAGNYLESNVRFSTYDQDNMNGRQGCAVTYQGGWWYHYYSSSYRCGLTRLNTLYRSDTWWNGFSSNIVRSEMKFRRLLDD